MNKQSFNSALLNEKYTKYTHPSGLDIYILPKQFTTSYAIFGVKYGSIHSSFRLKSDPDNLITVPDGIAHFLEHKLFANEDGSDSFERFSELGADANAYTDSPKTAYLFSSTANFYKSLRELIKFVTHPYFTEENIASEIGIISEEIKMYNDYPSERCFYGMLEGLYEHHSIRRNTAGTVETIKQITPELLYQCYKAFYNLNNMALFICGDVEDEKVLQIANELLPQSSAPFEVIYQNENEKESPHSYKKYVESKMQLTKPIFSIGIKDTSIPSDSRERQKREIAYDILNEIIFSQAGELYSSLLERNIISPNLSYSYTISPTYAYTSLSGEADDPSLTLNEIISFVNNLKEKGLLYEEFLRGKRVIYADFVKIFDSVESIANELLSFAFDDTEIFSYADIIESVTFDYVNDIFKNSFDTDAITLSVVLPLTEKQDNNQDNNKEEI